MELPHLQEMYKENSKKGLAIVAMNYGDTTKDVNAYWKKSGFTFPAVMAPQAWHDKYRVAAYPTNYVVDKAGVIKARFIGFDPEGLKKAIRNCGVPVK